MQIFIAQAVNGLAVGSIYALVVVGVNLLLLVRGIMHVAYAHIVVISMYSAWLVLQLTNSNLLLAISAALVTAIVVTTVTEPIFRPLALRQASLETVVVALGIGMILTDIMSHFLNYGKPITFPAGMTGGGAMVRFGLATFSLAHLYTLLGGIGAVIALLYLLYRHRQGRAFRAMAQNLEVARLMGIPYNRTGLYSFAVAGLLGGITAVLAAMTLGSASPSLGDSLSIKSLVLVLFAGTGNLRGGLICALIIGLTEALLVVYLPGRWTEAIVYGVIMVSILARPQGLFGTQT